MSEKAKQIVDFSVKLLLLAVALYLIWQKTGLEAYRGFFSYRWHHAQLLIPAFFILALVNLWLDGRIWQRVHHFIGKISLKRALKTNFVCYALSFVTPVNSGEVAGRYVMLKHQGDRSKTLFLTFWSHFPRLVTKLTLGGTAILLLLPLQEGFTLGAKTALLAGWNLGVIAFYLLFIRIQRWISGYGWRKWQLQNYILQERPRTPEKLHLLLLAIAKYLTYNVQFLALLLMWSGQPWQTELFLAVLAFFFVSALVPTFPAADFLVKGAIAIYIFKNVLPNDTLLLHTTLAIWIVNIALPALAGMLIISKSNIMKTLKKRVPLGSRYGL